MNCERRRRCGCLLSFFYFFFVSFCSTGSPCFLFIYFPELYNVTFGSLTERMSQDHRLWVKPHKKTFTRCYYHRHQPILHASSPSPIRILRSKIFTTLHSFLAFWSFSHLCNRKFLRNSKLQEGWSPLALNLWSMEDATTLDGGMVSFVECDVETWPDLTFCWIILISKYYKKGD